MQLDKFEDADFKYDNSFSNSSPKIPKQGTFGPKFKDFFLHQTLEQDIFEDHDLKHDNNIFKFQPKVPKYKIFFENSEFFFFLSETLSKLNFI